MYSTCLHCHAALGSNESIEAFPVGKRLAFDAAKGRLWVICPACSRWNLTPLEERWEAVEDCERQFRSARQRVSKGEIGLSHLRSGAHLVRIGAPPATEMAAWRYGDVLRKRWVSTVVPLGLVLGSMYGAQLAINVTGSLALGGGAFFPGIALIVVMARRRSARARLLLPDGLVKTVGPSGYGRAMIEPDADGRWLLCYDDTTAETRVAGPAGAHTLRGLLTLVNRTGAREAQLQSALELLSRAGSPDGYIARLATAATRSSICDLRELPVDVRCALEMALHDDAERKAMSGELDALAAEWKLAEEIAQIADNMFLPDSVQQRLAQFTAPA